MSSPKVVTCEECQGGGYILLQTTECCGDWHPHNGCRGHCGVTVDIQEPCPVCHGEGTQEIPAEDQP